MSEDWQERWRMWKPSRVALAKDHRLNAAKDSSESDSKRNQEEWSCPGVLPHGRCENEKFACEDAKWGHAQNRQRPEHKPPADRWADACQAPNAIHLLCALSRLGTST